MIEIFMGLNSKLYEVPEESTVLRTLVPLVDHMEHEAAAMDQTIFEDSINHQFEDLLIREYYNESGVKRRFCMTSEFLKSEEMDRVVHAWLSLRNRRQIDINEFNNLQSEVNIAKQESYEAALAKHDVQYKYEDATFWTRLKYLFKGEIP